MLILFKPWRDLGDLKERDETWAQAFDRTVFSAYALSIMNIENECKDARDKYEVLRRSGKANPMLPGFIGPGTTDVESLTNALERDAALDFDFNDGDDESDETHDATNDSATAAIEREILLILGRTTLWKNRSNPATPFVEDDNTSLTTEEDRAEIKTEWDTLKTVGRDKRPATAQLESERPTKRQRTSGNVPQDAETTIGELQIIQDTIYQRNEALDDKTTEQHLEEVITELNIRGNQEQERAIRIIAEHFLFGMEKQLLLYIAGVGGAGKSHVIKAVVEFFRRCSVSDSMLLSAPTGCAAVLINGFTIHALTFLPKQKDESLVRVQRS
ncbi:hypothetical protein C8R45DRAFT_937068 [Mycena sanguinolenta]|nr:hypothetical protein C8R45DRAFT_937068 [Mycena sanguinolenta]